MSLLSTDERVRHDSSLETEELARQGSSRSPAEEYRPGPGNCILCTIPAPRSAHEPGFSFLSELQSNGESRPSLIARKQLPTSLMVSQIRNKQVPMSRSFTLVSKLLKVIRAAALGPSSNPSHDKCRQNAEHRTGSPFAADTHKHNKTQRDSRNQHEVSVKSA